MGLTLADFAQYGSVYVDGLSMNSILLTLAISRVNILFLIFMGINIIDGLPKKDSILF